LEAFRSVERPGRLGPFKKAEIGCQSGLFHNRHAPKLSSKVGKISKLKTDEDRIMAEISLGNHCVTEKSGRSSFRKDYLIRCLARGRPEAVLEEPEYESRSETRYSISATESAQPFPGRYTGPQSIKVLVI
jgi:hypothetical protein